VLGDPEDVPVVLLDELLEGAYETYRRMREEAPVYYVIRLVAYGLIVVAIVGKNRERR